MYLRATGWRPEGHDGTLARWTRPTASDEGDFEIIQPLDPAGWDYAALVGDAVATLAVAEDRSELDVLRGMTAASTDVHSVRILPPAEPPGQSSP